MLTEETKKLSISLTSGVFTNEEFIQAYSDGRRIDKEYVINLFNEAINNKDAEAVEEALTVGIVFDFFSNEFSEIFCKLLQADWHYKHEDIAGLLQDLKDPSTVDCLYNAAQLHFEYLNYDDSYQFARKCIKALSKMGNKEAIEKLQLLAGSNIPEIKQYAVKELKYKGLL
ncbi:MAG TPA: HEAT repeat domain-containing protein [Pyrinomonadaceae bacterium]|jgi:hypothetical protein